MKEPLGPDDPTRDLGRDAPADPSADVTRTGGPGAESGAPAPLPEKIGEYRVVGPLGRGGMGEVLEAVQEGALRRRVALKLIQHGIDSQEVISRFESERQALALMGHECIARVYDAGTTADGRPYFAMEYVDGKPVTHYCDERRLPVHERLELFLGVCDGVRHAHQKGIIHRDLKPSNVLVTEQDGRPVAKIIDFGIAKATAQPLTDDAVATQMGLFVGTPAYMSPEQADLSGLDVDTRTDVYSLGVMLYELLVGRRPFDDANKASSFDEMRRRVREDDPSRPSTVVSSGTATRHAEHRGTDARSLSSQLRGDLDWIVTRALEKDRDRRYQSAGDLAADIRRHLRDEAVLAGPPSTRYRLGKFVRRHRLGVAAAGLILLAVVVGAVTATVGMVRAVRAERIATREANVSGRVTEFLVGLFEVPDPREGRGADVTAREILELGTAKLQADLADQDEVRATLLTTIGRVYVNLGMHDDAVPLLEEALSTRVDLLGAQDPAVAETSEGLGVALRSRAEFPAAQERFQEALEIRRAALGDDHPAVAESLADIATVRMYLGDLPGAETFATESLAVLEGHDDADPLTRALNYQVIGNVRLSGGDPEAAERAFASCLEQYRAARGEEHVEVATALVNLGMALAFQGRAAEAEAPIEDGNAMLRRILEADHPIVAHATMARAFVLHDLDKNDEAESAAREAFALHMRLYGPDHPKSAESHLNLARVLNRCGKSGEALGYIEKALQLFDMVLPPDHWIRAHAESVRGASLAGVGRFEEAERTLLAAHDTLRVDLRDSVLTMDARRRLAELYDEWSRPEDAARFRTESR